MTKKTALPKLLYIQHRQEGRDDWLDVSQSLDQLGDDVETVGVYELKEVKQLRISRELL